MEFFCSAQDAVAAYEIQNSFLNKEILELTNLRADDEVREKEITA